jgi:hypothetical protein
VPPLATTVKVTPCPVATEDGLALKEDILRGDTGTVTVSVVFAVAARELLSMTLTETVNVPEAVGVQVSEALLAVEQPPGRPVYPYV